MTLFHAYYLTGTNVGTNATPATTTESNTIFATAKKSTPGIIGTGQSLDL